MYRERENCMLLDAPRAVAGVARGAHADPEGHALPVEEGVRVLCCRVWCGVIGMYGTDIRSAWGMCNHSQDPITHTHTTIKNVPGLAMPSSSAMPTLRCSLKSAVSSSLAIPSAPPICPCHECVSRWNASHTRLTESIYIQSAPHLLVRHEGEVDRAQGLGHAGLLQPLHSQDVLGADALDHLHVYVCIYIIR